MQVYPVSLISDKKEECFSYICVPLGRTRTFLPQNAKKIKGLVPSLHYKKLTDNQEVTLEDGTVVTPDMVCSPLNPS